MNAVHTDDALKATRQSFALLVRVLDGLCTFELQPEMLERLNEYLGTLLRSHLFGLAKLLRCVSRRVASNQRILAQRF